MLEAGILVGKKLQEIPNEFLTESVRERVYHLHIETQGITNEENVARKLVDSLYNKFRAKVIWIRIQNGVIDMQLIGSPFAWVALIGFLPAILSILGIVMVLVAIYNVIAAIPAWAWATLAIGVGVIILGPTIAGAVTKGTAGYIVAETPTKRAKS